MKTWIRLPRQTLIPVKTGKGWMRSTPRSKRVPLSIKVRRRFTSVRTAATVLTRRTASKGTIARRRWKSGLRALSSLSSFWPSDAKAWSGSPVKRVMCSVLTAAFRRKELLGIQKAICGFAVFSPEARRMFWLSCLYWLWVITSINYTARYKKVITASICCRIKSKTWQSNKRII